MAQIIWTEPALHDLESIADYIALDRPEAAQRLVQEVFARGELLRKHPLLGSTPAELRGLPYRHLVIPPCRLFYRVEKKIIYIVHLMRSEQLLRLQNLGRRGDQLL